MPLAQANPPLVGARGRPRTRGKWPRASLILPNAGQRNYSDRALEYGPIAYFPLWEASGTTIECLVSATQNGTASSDVSGWPPGEGVGDGNTALLFDGTNDYIDILTASLATAFDGDEGTAMFWCKVEDSGVWSDGTKRIGLYAVDTTDWNEYVNLYKNTSDNQMRYRYSAGGTLENITQNNVTTLLWFHIAVTWSASADEVKAYYNGVQEGTTQTSLGTWVGAINRALIGAESTAPANPWQGWLAHCLLFDKVLTQPEIANLATV